MADNVPITAGTGTNIATRNVTYSGDSTQAQAVGIVVFAGADDAKTATDVSTSAPFPITDIGGVTNASGQVTITNSSATIIASRAGRDGVLIVNNQSVPVYIDAAGGTASTSKFRLDPGAGIYLHVTSTVTGITSAAYTASPADATVHYCEIY